MGRARDGEDQVRTSNVFRAFCDDCRWVADDAWSWEESAYEDLNVHVQAEHAGHYGVRIEKKKEAW